jgi:hypothetical protein
VVAFEEVSALEDADLGGRTVGVDRGGPGIEQPDGTATGGEPFTDPLLDLLGGLTRGDDLDGQVRREGSELLGRPSLSHPLAGDEGGVRSAHGVRSAVTPPPLRPQEARERSR